MVTTDRVPICVGSIAGKYPSVSSLFGRRGGAGEGTKTRMSTTRGLVRQSEVPPPQINQKTDHHRRVSGYEENQGMTLRQGDTEPRLLRKLAHTRVESKVRCVNSSC